MFYGTEQEWTAADEVKRKAEEGVVTLAVFETSRECKVVDLARMPEVPSLFDPEHDPKRRSELVFLHHFAEDISKTVKEGDETTEYLPTQEVAAYLLKKLKPKVQGILYKSSFTKQGCDPRSLLGGVSVALAVTNWRCIESESYREKFIGKYRLCLVLVPGSKKEITVI